MIKFGRSARWYNSYDLEVDFCKKHGFDFMQAWYKDGALLYDDMPEPKEEVFLKAGFPIIIHAVFTIEDYAKYQEDLLRILKLLGHREVIIHPVRYPLLVEEGLMGKLAECIKKMSEHFYDNGITLYIENNGKLDPHNYSPEDFRLVFDHSPKTEFLLDIAHIDSYEHLRKLIDVKYPKMLHISDKRFAAEHEHLPIGMGDLDFELIFAKYLSDFVGDVILEIPEEDAVIIDSLAKIKRAMFHML